MNEFFDKLWHKTLGKPYSLACKVDAQSGIPVVMLHGIGRSSVVWNFLIGVLSGKPYRLVAFDLLGFGSSPKPSWPKYDADDHARAVIQSMKDQKITSPAVLVGHSMGCLVAVRVAQLRPDLVRHLVLYEMPLYGGLPEKRRYQMRLKLYQSVYARIISYENEGNSKRNDRSLAVRLARKLELPEPSHTNWRPFIRSLENTILHQTTAEDIKKLSVPMDVIYGSRDMFVIRGEVHNIFGSDATNITAHTLKVGHTITLEASKFIAERIDSALSGRSALPPKQASKPPTAELSTKRRLTSNSQRTVSAVKKRLQTRGNTKP
jgi:pimeloyl-ACP methyl ester carboxylesterase